MSKAYPSNLTHRQYEFLRDLILEAKPGGRKCEVDMWEVLNAIFYILVEGVRWRCLRQPEAGTLPGDFPAWQTVYTYLSQCGAGVPPVGASGVRNWRQDGTWLLIHDSLREWKRKRESTSQESI